MFQGYYFISDKHHCRACGNIICSSCSTTSTGSLRGINLSYQSNDHKICGLCNYGQDEIDININTQCNSITISQLIPRMNWVDNNELKTNDDYFNRPTLGLWKYGVVRSIQVKLSLVFIARRQQQPQPHLNHQKLSYIFIYTSPYIPYNNNGSKAYNTENIYMLINEREKSKNDDDIFSVTIHPNVMKEYFMDLYVSRTIRNKVCSS